MATPRKNSDERSISRTYRAAVRIGEDFITVEETITLPLDAAADEVTQAVELGLRIYQAQREAVEAQISTIRESAGAPAPITVRDPDAPASDKQRNYIGALQEDLSWSGDQLAAYATEQAVDIVTMTKGQASTFIDGLKKLAEERPSYNESPRQAAANPPAVAARPDNGQPANERQIHALERLAQQQGLELNAETTQRFGGVASAITSEQAATLLREWQRPQQGRRTQTGELPF